MKIFKSIFLIFLLFGFYNFPPQECDIWWHLMNGREIIINFSWPSPDHYSYTAFGTVWAVHSWLADCVFFCIHEFFGFAGLSLFRLFLHTCFAIFFYISAMSNKTKTEYAYILSMIAMFLVWHREIRPFLFSQIAACILYTFVRTSSPEKHWYLWMPLTMVLWMNMHPMSLIFSLFFLVTFSSYIAIKLNAFDSIRTPYSKRWYNICALSFISSLIHPTPILILIRFIKAPTYVTSDWSSLLHAIYLNLFIYFPYMAIYVLIFIIYIIYVLSLIRKHATSNTPIYIYEELLNIIFILLAYKYIRTCWVMIFPLSSAIFNMAYFKTKKNTLSFRWEFILLIFIILQLFRGELPSQFYFPKDAMKYWNDHEMKGNVYTDWQWAGYITWKSNGTAKIFVDTRIEPFSSELIAMAQPININLIDNLGFLHKLKTEYLLLPIPECNNFIKLSTVSGLCTLLNKGDYYALMALNEERIKKMYY